MGFTINIAKGFKKKSISDKPNKISRLCTGVVVIDNGDFHIRISTNNDADYPDHIVIPFTKDSLSLKGKIIVFSHKKDKTGRYVRYIRDERWCKLHPGLPTQYSAVIEGEICSGHVVRINGKLYFDMKNVHGRGEFITDLPVRLDDSKPLFR